MPWHLCGTDAKGFWCYPAGFDATTFVEYIDTTKPEFMECSWYEGPGWYMCGNFQPMYKRMDVDTLEEAKAVAAMLHHME